MLLLLVFKLLLLLFLLLLLAADEKLDNDDMDDSEDEVKGKDSTDEDEVPVIKNQIKYSLFKFYQIIYTTKYFNK